MRSIQVFIRDSLNEFLSLNHRQYFAENHEELVRALTTEQWISGNHGCHPTKHLAIMELFQNSDGLLTS